MSGNRSWVAILSFTKGRAGLLVYMVWIGTSGFQYPEWKGSFYPENLPPREMLAYYAGRLATTEINYSFYRIPSISTLEHWAEQTPNHFQFSLKAPQRITHELRLRDAEETLGRFWQAVSHLQDQLGVVLFQLPPNFRKELGVLNDFLDLLPASMRCAFEFRHASWFDEEVFASLRQAQAALCIADSDKLSTPLVVTAGHGYYRLRKERYSTRELQHWASAISEHSWDHGAYVYFKHEDTGTGPRYARQLRRLLHARAPATMAVR